MTEDVRNSSMGSPAGILVTHCHPGELGGVGSIAVGNQTVRIPRATTSSLNIPVF